LRQLLKKRLTADQSPPANLKFKPSSWEEKRSHPRLSVSWRAVIETDHQTMEVQLKDISIGGAFIVCRHPLALNEKFRLKLLTPEHDSLTLNAEVVWSNSNVPADKIIYRGMGARFTQNTDQKRHQLGRLIQGQLETE
jgi:c-di-GMP-binding flagellar brake protein YcgR